MAGRSRLVPILGVSLVAVGGYYLYSAGGNPKVAEKKFEHDAAAVSSQIKSGLPGRGKEAEKKGEEWAAQAAAKVGSTVDSATNAIGRETREADAAITAKARQVDSKISQGLAKAEDSFEKIKKDTRKDIDKFDQTVERKAAEAKSGISSWLGFGK